MKNTLKCMAAALLCTVMAHASAQDANAPQDGTWPALEQGLKATPLTFDLPLQTRDQARQFKNQVITPVGAGPFPAVVLMPSCAGVNEALENRAKELLDAGFAVFAVDSFGPRRKMWWHCPEVVLFQMADTFAALNHLQKFDAIDKKRIYAAGWSTGGGGPVLAASPEGRKAAGATLRFAAVAVHYGNCAYQESPKVPVVRVLRRDTDSRVLMLIAESDVPVSNCFPLLDEMKAATRPVEWHVFQGAHHLWDRPDETRRGRENGFGQKISFKHDPEITRQATQRMIDFFSR